MKNIINKTIEQLRYCFMNKQSSIHQLLNYYINRICELDSTPNGLNSISELNPDIWFIADALDSNITESNLTNYPLYGIPILLKDNIETKDKLHTSAGTLALSDNYAVCDAYVVKLLRQAGAIIMGKTNMTELANSVSVTMPSGYSSRGGFVKSPYGIDPSGSSTGSAVAVAADLCTIALGTETAGSVMKPSIRNGIVGLKPSLGLISRSGIIPVSTTLDTVGIMGRSVYDVASVLGVIAKADCKDKSTIGSHITRYHDYRKFLSSADLKGINIGINTNYFDELSDDEQVAFNNLCKLLSESGAHLSRVDFNRSDQPVQFMKYEFKGCINQYLAKNRGSTRIKSLDDIIKFNNKNPEETQKYGQDTLIGDNLFSGTFTEAEYLQAVIRRDKYINDFKNIFNERKLDVILCAAYTNIAPYTGFPSITIPIGYSKEGSPIGTYWIGDLYNEASLLRITYTVEQKMRTYRN